MLGKLFKHDFRAFARTLWPMQLGVLGGGVLAAILSRLSSFLVGANVNSTVASGFMTLFGVLSMLLTVLLVVVIFASAIVTLILICIRVQKSFFDDEGYLTFSLPTTTGRLLWSKIITGTLWMLINGVVIVVTLFLFSAFGTGDTFVNMNVLQVFGNLFGGFGDLVVSVFTEGAVPGMWLMAVTGVLDGLAFLLLQVLSLYFAVIAGGMASRRHKLLAAIGIYLIVHFALGFASTACMGVAVLSFATANPVGAVWFLLLVALLVLGGIDVGLFCWSRHLLKDKLNLQ